MSPLTGLMVLLYEYNEQRIAVLMNSEGNADVLNRVPKSAPKVVRFVAHELTNRDLVEGLRRGDVGVAAAFYDRFAVKINRLVWRLLGADTEHDDVVNQVFVNILSSIKKLRHPEAFDDWICGIAVNTVRKEIRSRKYRRILVSVPEYQERKAEEGETEKQVLVRRVFKVLNTMKTEDRIAFILRYVEGNTLGEVAVSGGYSLATAKRRIARAKREFLKRVRKDTALASFIEEIKDV